MGWSVRAVISPHVCLVSRDDFEYSTRLSYRAVVRVGQAGPFCFSFSGMSPLRSLLPSSTPCSPTLALLFPLPFREHKHETLRAYNM